MNRWRYSITVLNILCHVLTALIVSKFSDSFYTTLRIVHGCMLGNRDLTVSLRCVLVHLHYNWNQVSNKVIQYPMIKHMPYKSLCANQKIFCKIWVCDFIKMSISTKNLGLFSWHSQHTLGIVWLLSFEKRTTATTQATFDYFRYFTVLDLTLCDKLNKAMKTAIRVESKIYCFSQWLIWSF